jgi:hypothetical protein
MDKKFAYLTMAVIVLIYMNRKVNVRCCKCFAGRAFTTISTVTKGMFQETIPQTGKVTASGELSVTIDKLYATRIKTGLPATASINNREVHFTTSDVDTAVMNGRFSILMELGDTTVKLRPDQSVRIRIQLSEPREEVLIPVGGFYKDTGGEWIYVMTDDEKFEKRRISLGRKNPEYFVVLDGVRPGDKVLTSSYENFMHRDHISLWEINATKPLSIM